MRLLMRSLAVLTLALVALAAPVAPAADCTLSDWAIMQLDYDLSHYYEPDPTSVVLDRRDVPGPGVEFDIWYKGNTDWTDCTLHRHSSIRGGAGTLVGLDVSAYDAFALQFELLAVDGQWDPPTDGRIAVGAVIGPTASGHQWGYRPEWLSTHPGGVRTVVSRTNVGATIVQTIGITAYSPPGEGWSPDGMVVTLKVGPAPGAVPIPEPGTAAAWSVVGGALLIRRRR